LFEVISNLNSATVFHLKTLDSGV